MPGNMPIKSGEKRVEITDQDNDVDTYVAGQHGYETIWDLSPSTDIYYKFLKGDHPQLGSEGNLRFRMVLPQEGGGSTEIGDNAKIRIVAQGPEEDEAGADVMGRVFRYRTFSQADLFDEDDVPRLHFQSNFRITEAAHLKVQVDNSTNGNDVDLSQSGGFLSVEGYRGTER